MARPGYNEDNTLNTSVFSPQNNGNTGREQYIADQSYNSSPNKIKRIIANNNKTQKSYEGTGIIPQVFPDYVTKNPNSFDMMNNWKLPGKNNTSWMGSPMFLDAGITNRNLGGAKVMNATNYLDPLDGHNIMNGRTIENRKVRNGNEERYLRDFWTADNPNTGTRYSNTNVEAPNWSYERRVDPSGFGQEKYNNDPFTNFMMKGGGQDYDGRGLPEGIETLEAGMGDSYQSLQQQINDLDPDSSNYDDMLEMLNNDMEMKYPYMMAELTEDQMNMMGNMYNTPALGGVSKEDLYNKTKDMEDKGFFGFGAQEPTTREEFEDYYRKLQQGTVGNWVT